MQTPSSGRKRVVGPKRRQRHYSYDENVDEAPTLIEDEPVEVEHEVPAEENASEQQIEPEDSSPHPPFEN